MTAPPDLPQPERLPEASLDVAADRVEQLRAIFPEVFREGRVDFDALRRSLGDWVDPGKERFGLNWPGKAACMRVVQQPSVGTLRPDRAESVDFDTTQNLVIEGDNLEVLKLLGRSYHGKVKMIYIDPPYNTGNEFIYPDNWQEGLQTYLRYSGQVDGDGTRLSTNTEASGRYHSNWLSMMYPRLYLARNLLRDDGVIFVSIDDHEVASLRFLLDDVFGEENFFAVFPWQSRTSVQNDVDISEQHEYVVGYARRRRFEHRRLKEANAEFWYDLPSFAAFPKPLDKSRYSNPDSDPRGPWKADPFDAPNVRPNLTYEIVNPMSGVVHLPPLGRHWRTEEATYRQLVKDGRIVFGQTGNARPQLKVFYNEKRDFGETPTTWLDGGSFGTATEGTRDLQSLFEGKSPFDFPKPASLVQGLLSLATRMDDLVLDFFAGSGGTAQAVMQANQLDAGHRRYILVQLPEPTEGAFPTIADITRERVRRAAAELRPTTSGQLALDGATDIGGGG